MGLRLCSDAVKAAVPTKEEVTGTEEKAESAAPSTGPVKKAEAPPTKKATAKKEK